jgi:hypothetical protein
MRTTCREAGEREEAGRKGRKAKQSTKTVRHGWPKSPVFKQGVDWLTISLSNKKLY